MSDMDGVSDDLIVKTYLKIRKARADASSEAAKVDSGFKSQLETLEQELLRRMRERNNTGFRTEYGSVFREMDFKPSAENWDEVYHWIVDEVVDKALERTGLAPSVKDNVKYAFKMVQPERFEILEKRLKKTTIGDYMEAHHTIDDETGEKLLGAPPPGVKVLREYVARVRVNNKG